jgi:hypothetical protein
MLNAAERPCCPGRAARTEFVTASALFTPDETTASPSGAAVLLLPWIWLVVMATFVDARCRGRVHRCRWMFACSVTPPLILVAVVGIWSHGPVWLRWVPSGYLVLFPLVGATLARWEKTEGRDLRRGAAACACLIMAVVTVAGSELRWNWLPFAGTKRAPAVDRISRVPCMPERGWIRSHEAIMNDKLGDVLILAPGTRATPVERSPDSLFQRRHEYQPAEESTGRPVGINPFHAAPPAMEIPDDVGACW